MSCDTAVVHLKDLLTTLVTVTAMTTMLLPPTGGAWQKVNGKWEAVKEPVKSRAKQEKEFDIEEMLKKYSERLDKQKKKKKKKKKACEPIEWVDKSFIKNYSDHDEMKDILGNIQEQYPEIAERYSGCKK